MSHLIVMSVGPVQEFITAARRTRDLWFGSYLLSEISKAVAKYVRDSGGGLIFPHPEADLQAASDLNVANVILAELASGDPKKLAQGAKETARNRWLEFAEEARRKAQGAVWAHIWNDQVEDVIEFYAAWVERTSNYKADRIRLMRLLAGRKNCRDFLPARGRAGVPKSSLDGRRESVLKPPEKWPRRLRARLRIKEGEQLDVVGLVKRVAGGERPYPSVSRIAADPWIRGNKDKAAFKDVFAACRRLGDVVHKLDQEKFPQYRDFPFEGTVVYRSRHREWLKETELREGDLEPLREALRNLPEPEPYLAVLVADGDRMGATISRLDTPEMNRAFSQTLADFAADAKPIVEGHNGVLVYAGGDDVLAFVPLDKCLACARQLHDEFGRKLNDYRDEDGNSPTLSVGIAIGHFMEDLENLLEYGRMAEKTAKRPDRNGLAIHLHKRGGAPVSIRDSWKRDPDKRLSLFAEMFERDEIPGGLPYELRDMGMLYDAWPSNTAEEKKAIADAIQRDLLRLLAKKQPTAGKVRGRLQPYIAGFTPSRLRLLADELLVARQIGCSVRQANQQQAPAMEATP